LGEGVTWVWVVGAAQAVIFALLATAWGMVQRAAQKRDSRLDAHSLRLDTQTERLTKIETSDPYAARLAKLETEMAALATRDDLHDLRDEVRTIVKESATEIVDKVNMGRIEAGLDEVRTRIAHVEKSVEVSREVRRRGARDG